MPATPPMENWPDLAALIDAMLDTPAEQRAVLIEELSAGDPEHRAALERLREDCEREAALLNEPAAERFAALFEEDTADFPEALVARYHPTKVLGRGGMAIVYLAHDLKHGRDVAVKLLLGPTIAGGSRRFLREIAIAAKLSHPHILALHDSGEAGGVPYYVMPYVAGESLRDRLQREQQLPVDEALRLTREVASALSYAHGEGVVHRDIKPENILLQAGQAVVADFGVARALSLAGGQSVTEVGEAVGTPAYMSPEQAEGARELDGRSDVYSLGCVLYEMLAGHPPYAGTTAREILARHAFDPVPSLQAARPDVSEALERSVGKALAKVPAARFATADEFGEAIAAAAATGGPGSRRWWRGLGARRELLRWSARLGVAALLLVATVLGARLWHDSPPQAGFTTSGSEAKLPIASLAVLPLKYYSGDPTQEYFADGMTEELITTLSKIEALRVIAHQSVLQFKHSDQSVPQIARLLNVKHVVDGSVLQDRDRVRITVSLIDAASNTPVWGERFERERRDVMALQREVALAIAGAIEIALTPQDLERLAGAPPVDPEAFDLYVRGTQARYRVTPRALSEAADYFTRAINKDSTYAPTHAGLASVYAFRGDRARATLHAERALALDPNMAEAHVVVGLIRQLYDLDWTGAEAAFRQAIRLNPGYAEAHHELSLLLMRLKRFDEALREARFTLYLAPMSERFQEGLGEVYLFSGHYEEALEAAAAALALDSSSAVYALQGLVYAAQARYEEAVVALKKGFELGCTCLGDLGYVYGVSGRRVEAIQVLDTLQARWEQRSDDSVHYQIPVGYQIAVVHAGLGHREQALELLERAVDKALTKNGPAPLYLGIDRALRSLHAEPRFQALLEKMGLDG